MKIEQITKTEAAQRSRSGVWPEKRRATLDWLMMETKNERFIDNILVEMCRRLVDEGVPVARATLHIRTLHPQWLGARMLWKTGMSEAELRTFDYGIEDKSQYINSPSTTARVKPADVSTQSSMPKPSTPFTRNCGPKDTRTTSHGPSTTHWASARLSASQVTRLAALLRANWPICEICFRRWHSSAR